MNDVIHKLFKKHDLDLFEHVKKIINVEVFVKLPYEAQIGIVDSYLYEIKKCVVVFEESKPCILYYIEPSGHFVKYVLEGTTKDYVSNKLLGYNYLLINKYLPF